MSGKAGPDRDQNHVMSRRLIKEKHDNIMEELQFDLRTLEDMERIRFGVSTGELIEIYGFCIANDITLSRLCRVAVFKEIRGQKDNNG